MDAFYSSIAWQKLRARVRRSAKATGAPCHYCRQPLDWVKQRGVSIDHIINRKVRPDLSMTESNLAAVCHTCNSKKAAWLDHSTTPQIGTNGFPAGSAWGKP